MFGKLFKKRSEPESGPLMLFMLLPDAKPIDHAPVLDALRRKYPMVRSAVSDVTPEQTFNVNLSGTDVMVAHMPAPIPTPEVAECTAISRFWDGSPEQTAHQSHAVLVSYGPQPPKVKAQALNRVATAVSMAGPTVGWYVGSASHVLSPALATELEDDDGDLGIMAWVNVIATPDGLGRASLSTIGMETFGHREFEIVGTTADPGEWFTRLLDLANYVMDAGPVLKHGQTFGATADEKIGIEVGKSRLGKNGTVIRLLVP